MRRKYCVENIIAWLQTAAGCDIEGKPYDPPDVVSILLPHSQSGITNADDCCSRIAVYCK